MSKSVSLRSSLSRLKKSRPSLAIERACVEVLESRKLLDATLISVNDAGTDSGNARSSAIAGNTGYQHLTPQAVNADGRFVVFTSVATDLVTPAPTTPTTNVYVRDRQLGTTTLLSVNAAGVSGTATSGSSPAITPDGRFVTFITLAPLAANDNNTTDDVYLVDLQAPTITPVLVSVDSTNTNASGGVEFNFGPAPMSSDGRFIAFTSIAANLVTGFTGPTNVVQLYIRDMQTGVTTLVSHSSSGATVGGSADSHSPLLSADGQFIVYASLSNDLISTVTDTNALYDLFQYSVAGATTKLLTPDTTGLATANAGIVFDDTGNPGPTLTYAMSSTSGIVVFESTSTNLLASPTTALDDIYVRNTLTDTTTLGSSDSAGVAGAAASDNPGITPDGRYLVFSSSSDNLVTGGPTGDKVFRKDLNTGTTILVSPAFDPSTNAIGGSVFAIDISDDGNFVAFETDGTNLVSSNASGSDNGLSDIFVRDIGNSRTYLLSNAVGSSAEADDDSSWPVVVNDGTAVFFVSFASNLVTTDTNGGAQERDVFVALIPAFVATPNAVTGLTATTQGSQQILLNWVDVANETGYRIERSPTGTGSWTSLGTVLPDVTTFTDTGLTPNTQYFYRVIAFNIGGDAVPSNIASATTTVIQSPTAPANLTAVAVSASQINLTWQDRSSNESGFIIERARGGSPTFMQVGTVGVNVTTFSDTGLAAATRYTYRVRASIFGDNSKVSAPAAATTLPIVQIVSVVALSGTQVKVTWQNNSTQSIGFRIDRAPGDNLAAFQEIGRVTNALTNNFTDNGVEPGKTYFYRVRAAFSSTGFSEPSQAVSVTTSGFATVDGGVLTFNGTGGDDVGSIKRLSNTLVTELNGTPQTFSGSISQILVFGLAGNDSFTLGSGVGAAYMEGGAGDDSLNGGDNKDTITGSAGNDKLFGGGGDDRINGFAGKDGISGGDGDDRIYGGIGNDFMEGGAGSDRIWGGVNSALTASGNDYLVGNSGADKLRAEDGDDTLTGNTGIDLFEGGDGNDTIYARDNAADTGDGGIGSNTAQVDTIDQLVNVTPV